MPPFKTALMKRKLRPDHTSNEKAASESGQSESESEELLGVVQDGNDSSDSEHDTDASEDDQKVEKVLFDDDADSTLGDEGRTDDDDDDEEDESSDLEDSDNSNESNEEGSDEESSEASDSGAESGLGQTTHSGSSDEEVTSPVVEVKKQPIKGQDGKVIKDKKVSKDIKLSQDGKESTYIKVSKDGKESKDSKATKSNRVTKMSHKQTNKDSSKEKDSIDVLADKIKETSVIQPVGQRDEYSDGDTSDEEERVNTAGDVPRWWYDEYPHVGYDLDGRRILRGSSADNIDHFLRQCEDPEFWRTVRDPSTGQDVILSAEDLQLIARIRQGQLPSPGHDEYQPWTEWFSREVLSAPVRAFPDHKRSFLPSRCEQRRVARIVHALKMGWTKTRKQIAQERRDKKERRFYDLWGSSASAPPGGLPRHIPPPSRPPPSHAESYRPPPEYLLDDKEMLEWDKLSCSPWQRKYTCLPTAYGSLRAVPAYGRLLRERFLRCLDLYLAPRAIKMRLTISPEELVPKLPSPRDLQPFPTSEVLTFRGHTGLVRSCDFDPSGEYALSGSDDCSVKVWETSTARCLRTIPLPEPVACAAWTPSAGLTLLAAAAGSALYLVNPGANVGAHLVAAATDGLLEEPPPHHDVIMDERTRSCVQWPKVSPQQWAQGIRIIVTHFKPIVHVSWHAKGDYVAVTLREAGSRSVVVHQVSRRRSQLPFRRAAGLVQAAVFHPTRPLLFVATQRVVRVYDLVKQELTRKLRTGAQWVSTLAVHPKGDNLLVASYDRKCIWFDLELSSEPYQTLRLHGGAVRAVAFHARYPLWASGGDDHNLIVSHGMVYNDLLQNPLLVPLKSLPAPPRRDALCALSLRWHPAQPWLLAAGADGTMRLYA